MVTNHSKAHFISRNNGSLYAHYTSAILLADDTVGLGTLPGPWLCPSECMYHSATEADLFPYHMGPQFVRSTHFSLQKKISNQHTVWAG